MGKKDKVVTCNPNHMCLFCGEEKESSWNDNQQYWECECSDTQLDRKILKEIQDLEISRPNEKFFLYKQTVLIEKK